MKVGGTEPVLQVFKTMNEEHFGELSFFRIYSGQITTGGDSFNANRNVTERIGQIFLLNGQTRETVSRLGAGDIGATVKLKNTHTGDTLCAAESSGETSRAGISAPEHSRRAATQGEG